MRVNLRYAAVALLLLALSGLANDYVEGQSKQLSKILYVLPNNLSERSRTNAQFAADVADLRNRLGTDGKYVRVGFSMFVEVVMSDPDVNVADHAALRNGLVETLTQIDRILTRAKTNNIPVDFSLVTAIRGGYDPLQREAERLDRRNMQWYMDGQFAPGWITLSRYARRLFGIYEPYVREVGAVLANRMAAYPSNLVSANGDGETELSFERSLIVNPAFNEQTSQLCDYSPFAVAEFRDWLRNGGLYAKGQLYAGQGYDLAARYDGDVSPAADSNGDGHTLNGDFGTNFTSWDLKHFNWSLGDPLNGDPNAIPDFVYNAPGFNGLPNQIPSGFDAPRVRNTGSGWWNTWDFFRQVMVWHYQLDFARWITTTVDPDTKTTVPVAKWSTHVIPADYLFGSSPANPNYRLVTSASPYWTGDITPYGGLGLTAFGANVGGGLVLPTALNVAPVIVERGLRWSIFEWNPSAPPSTSPAPYEAEMAMVEKYRPYVVSPYTWDGDPTQVVKNTPFETSLKSLIARIKDTPPHTSTVASPQSVFLKQGVTFNAPLMGGPPRIGGEPRDR
jgi:hypothetical protein